MRKNVLFLSMVALAFAMILPSCITEDSYACEQSQFVGTYNGSHNLSINQPIELSIPINDKIVVAAIAGSTDSVTIQSQTLGITLRAQVKDCKISIPASVSEFTYDLGQMIGRVKISGVNATLTVRKNTTKGQVESVISVQTGTANTLDNDLIDDLSIANTELPGIFK
ncbi:MAG TPA: hypothetical protein PKI48_05990 [Chitinophagales bacterium]|nr:hypothetical protein [Chitinophagales bacterium]